MPTFPRPYCAEADCYKGQATESTTGQTLTDYVTAAAEEMDSKIGFRYALPLAPDPSVVDGNGTPISAIPAHEKLLLKDINRKLATGRWLLAAYSSGDGKLDLYGLKLIEEAEMLLMMIANGDVDLSALPVAETASSLDRGPSIHNHDAESMVTRFEQAFHTPQYGYPVPTSTLSKITPGGGA